MSFVGLSLARSNETKRGLELNDGSYRRVLLTSQVRCFDSKLSLHIILQKL